VVEIFSLTIDDMDKVSLPEMDWNGAGKCHARG